MAHVNSKVRLTPFALPADDWTTVAVNMRCNSVELTADVAWQWCTDDEYKNQPRQIPAGVREQIADAGFSPGEAVCFVKAIDTPGTMWRKCVLRSEKGDQY